MKYYNSLPKTDLIRHEFSVIFKTHKISFGGEDVNITTYLDLMPKAYYIQKFASSCDAK